MGISLPNTPAYLVPSMAAMHSGAAAALLNPIYTPAEVEHALGIARCVVCECECMCFVVNVCVCVNICHSYNAPTLFRILLIALAFSYLHISLAGKI